MNVKKFVILIAAAAALSLALSCATRKPAEVVTDEEVAVKPVEVPVVKVPAKKETGIRGTVIPVDQEGKVLKQQERESAVISFVPKKNDTLIDEKKIALNPATDGSFFSNLREGTYLVEIFMKGFHVERLTIQLGKGEVRDLGELKIRRIEPEKGAPIKGGKQEEIVAGEGDVTIQPPTN